VETQLFAPLAELAPSKPLLDQDLEPNLRLIERVGELFGGVFGTGLTAEEGWFNVALPLLRADPDAEVPADMLAAAASKLGRSEGPVTLYLRYMPPHPEAPQSGILGLFAPDQLSAPHPRLSNLNVRIIRANPRALHPLLKSYDPERVRKGVQRFAGLLSQHTGGSVAPSAQESALLEDVLGFLTRLQGTLAIAIRDQRPFCVRRATASEAAAGPGKFEVRAALKS
jgi:hypothetical protein